VYAADRRHALFFVHYGTNDTMTTPDISVYDTLNALGIALPVAGVAAGAYVMSAQAGNTLFLSGHIAKRDGKVWAGKLGKDLNTDEGRLAARSVALDLIATLHGQTGDLNKVKRIVKVVSLVNSTPDFTEQHLVTNGASELFNAVFGAAGRHARSAFGVAQIPLGGCVEIELVVELAA
jgi:enamine deaminase RidA (YjgF/YER057c/UK114 family)